jgi:predicted dehydrogenase
MGETRIRVGVLGSGSISDYHIRGLQEAGAEVAALFSRNEEKVQERARHYQIPFATTRYADILELPEVDAVVIATPDFTHEEIAVAAAKAGKPMLLQKPMARNSQECINIITAAQEADVPLYVSFMHRYFGEVEATRRLLAEQALGSIYMVRQRNATPGADWAAWFYSKEKVGGGVVMQLGVHGIDLLRQLFGNIRAVQAATAITAKERVLAGGQVVVPDNEDLAFALYAFDGGLQGLHEMSYNEVAGTDRFRMEIYGERGTAWLRSERGPLAVNLGAGWLAPEIPAGDVGWRQHRHWLAMLRGAEPPDRSAQDGLAAVKVAEAIYRSAAKSNWDAVN